MRKLGSIGLMAMLVAALPTFAACTSSDPCPPDHGGCGYSTGPPTPESIALRRSLALGRAELRADEKTVRRLLCPGATVQWPIGNLTPRAHVDILEYEPTGDGWDVQISLDTSESTSLESTRTVHVTTARKVICIQNVS